MSEEGKTAGRLEDIGACLLRSALAGEREVVEPTRFLRAGRALTPRELVVFVLHVPPLPLKWAREFFATNVPVGAR